jgi:hypothetical protein
VILETEQRELETLEQLLEELEEGTVREALLNTWSNVFMIWRKGGEVALNHHGKVLSILERNRLQHVLNGNIKDEQPR